MKKVILALVLGLALAQPAFAQTANQATIVALMKEVVRLQTQLLALLQSRVGVPVGPAAVFFPKNVPIKLDYVLMNGETTRNQVEPGKVVTAAGSGFQSTMKVIVNGQQANDKAYTYVLTAYPSSPSTLSFVFPSDAPEGTLDVHLADGTTRFSRVSNTLLVEVER